MLLDIEARIKNIEQVTEFVNEKLKELGCPRKAMLQTDVALDELFSNICHYAYGDKIGRVTIEVQKVPGQEAVSITLADRGIPFDPLAKDDPDISLGLHERAIGGLGIFMVKKTMDDLKYEYRDGMNILTLIKKF